MSEVLSALTDKEKETLRLIVRGHDAKSAARELELSVHTINERLRAARRKLDVTSSREAARVLLESEGHTYENLAYEALGDAPTRQSVDQSRSGQYRSFLIGGLIAMSLIAAALLLPASPFAIGTGTQSGDTIQSEEAADRAAARAAEAFLELIDESRWVDSYAATSAQFQQINTLEVWTTVSQKVRAPLGKNLRRDLISHEYVPAPPNGVQMIKFASSYANGTNQVETVTLAWESGSWKVVGIVIG